MRSGLSPASAGVADSVRARAFTHLDARLTHGDPAPVALALSGGGDSLALLRLAAEWCAAARRPLLALTVDHGLHSASSGWTAFAGARARALGAAWRPLPWAGEKPATGLPAAARAARHALLAEAARTAGARVVLLGHTADDVAEGERMRAVDAPTLGRLRAWGPSPAWPQGRGVALLRPLLEVGRVELRAWLRAEGEAAWVDDPANDDLRSPRIRARRSADGAPPPSPAETPPELAALAMDAVSGPGGALRWSRSALAANGPSTRTRALAAGALCVGGGDEPPRAGRAAAFGEAALAAEAVRTLRGARLHAGDGAVVLTRAAPRTPLPAEALDPTGPWVWDGRFEVRADHPGWRVAALAGHAAGLPTDDRRALAAVAAAARPMLPVLLDPAGAPRLPRPFGGGPGEAVSLVALRLLLALGALRTEAELAACAGSAGSYPHPSPPCR